MMKIFSGIIFGLLFAAFPFSASALIISNDTAPYYGGIQIHHFEPLGQTFVATDTDIGYLGAYIESVNAGIGDLSFNMSLYLGEGSFSPDSLLMTQEFFRESTFNGYVDMDVSSLSFIKDQPYTLSLFNDTAQWSVAFTINQDPSILPGISYTFGIANPDQDLRYHVGPVSHPVPVPEPSTMFLFASILFGLAGTRFSTNKKRPS